MTYKETTDYLFNSYPVFEHVGGSAYKEGLYNTRILDEHFGHPHEAYKTIHVAGTNGKGSCSHTIAAILQDAGYRVGLYTSPHLVDFRERIRVNGIPISEERVITFVEQDRDFFEPLHPSFFELTTALAFLYFKEMKVDIAVVEVGLGGRLDCTNIITPLLSIITNISFDHTQFLGNTLEKIAQEKAGIIKKGVPVVIGEATAETEHVFRQAARAQQANIVFAESLPELSKSVVCPTGGRDYQSHTYGPFHGELGGDYQTKNTNTVLAAMNVLTSKAGNGEPKIHVNGENIRHGFGNVSELTGLAGRWQVLHSLPLVVCDTGHNVGGWQYLTQQIKAQKCRTARMVFGMVDDKDVEGVMRLLPRHAVYYWTQASTKRAFPSSKIKTEGEKHGLEGNCFPTVKTAYRQAMHDAAPDDFVFVGGSSYVVADLFGLNVF